MNISFKNYSEISNCYQTNTERGYCQQTYTTGTSCKFSRQQENVNCDGEFYDST